MSNVYEASLMEAKQELAQCEEAITSLERKQANLRQIIAVLQAKMGIEAKDQPRMNLTSAVLLVVKGTREMECITASDVLNRLRQMGIDAQPRSVATILCRLSSGRDRRINRLDDPGGSGAVGYEWKGVRIKSDALNATRALAEMGGRGVIG